MGKQPYFCAYMVLTNKVISGYGDTIFEGDVNHYDGLLEEIKDYLLKTFYNSDESVRIVVTSLNRV